MSKSSVRCIGVAAICLVASLAGAQGPLSEHPSVSPTFAQRAPTIDGIFDKDEWQGAATIDNFTQVTPSEGAPPSERTVVHFLYDTENLYIGVQCFDQSPDGVIGRQMQRESDFSSDDMIEIVLDPFGDKRNGYYFAISAGGGKLDGLVEPGNTINTLWDGLWLAKVTRNEEGWFAEIAIPFRNISFSPGIWGINFQRTIRRKQELVRWSAATQNQNFLDMIQSGSLTNMAGLKQGLGLVVRPFSAVALDLGDGFTNLRPGLDMAYKLTPSTTALITLNTDFAEAEIDDLVITLSRFPIFFPEKRAFFLQDASLFSFGGLKQSPIPFYSRRIGLANGARKDVLAGIKVTGRESFLNFGVIDVQMYDDPDLGSKNLSVGRVVANVLDQSRVGVFVTHGDPSTTGDNTFFGADFNYQNSHVFGDQTLLANAWIGDTLSFAGPASPNVRSGFDGNDYAFGGSVSFPNDKVSAQFGFLRAGERYRPALGFISRTGIWELYGNARYRLRMEGFLRLIDLAASTDVFLFLDGSLQSVAGTVPSLVIEDKFGDVFYMEHALSRDVLREPFQIIDDLVLPAGPYQFSRFVTGFDTSRNRPLYASAFFLTGGFYSGTMIEGSALLGWNMNKHFNIAAEYGLTKGFLDEGDFTIQYLIGSANIIFSPSMFLNTRIRWDTLSKSAGINSRFRYEVTPGQELFVVINQGFDVDDKLRFTKAEGQLLIKLGLTLSF